MAIRTLRASRHRSDRSIVSSIFSGRFPDGENKEAAAAFISALNEHLGSPAALPARPIREGEFTEYDRRHPYERQFAAILRHNEDADPHLLARAAVEAVFDHRMSPPMLDTELPTEDEVDQDGGPAARADPPPAAR